VTSPKGRSEVGATPGRFEVTLSGLRELRHRVDRKQLEPADWPLLGALVSKQIVRAEQRQDRMIDKIAAAASLTAATEAKEPGGEAGASSEAAVVNDAGASTSDANATSGGEPQPRAESTRGHDGKKAGGDSTGAKGHGRNGASAYWAAKEVFHTLEVGVIGAVCAVCRLAKMSRYREKVIIRIVGQPLFGAEKHHHEQGRCRGCGHIVRAQGSTFVHDGLGSDYVRYDWSACAMLMVMHYFGGAPFKRIESLHQGWGVPIADANQWELVNAGDDLLLPLYRALEQHAIQKATNFRIDDTGSVVIALKKQIDAEIGALESLGESTKGVRTGVNATGLYWETPNGPVILFYTGRHHAGEIVDQVLRRRLLSSPKLVKCTDGASKNFDHEHADRLVESTCNAHALLKFRDIKDKYPAEYAEAGRVYNLVFDNDDKAKALGLNAVERMLYHRQHSMPLMLQLNHMCEEKITSKLVEPNSPLWRASDFHRQSVGAADPLLRGARRPPRHQPRRTGAHHAGPLSRRLVQLPNRRRRFGRRPRDVPDRHGAGQRCRARRVLDGVPSLSRGPREEAPALPALGVPGATYRGSCGGRPLSSAADRYTTARTGANRAPRVGNERARLRHLSP
jgi:hypothetical protein